MTKGGKNATAEQTTPEPIQGSTEKEKPEAESNGLDEILNDFTLIL